MTTLPATLTEVKRTPIKFPKGEIGPNFTKKILPWIEEFWHEKGRYPEDSEIATRFGLNKLQITKLHSSKFYRNCLDRRGIALPDSDPRALTDRQAAAIAILTNFSDTRPVAARLMEAGITTDELQGWYANPQFKQTIQSRADAILDNLAPDATAELGRAINRGNFQAIKFYYEITGRANSPETINVKIAMQTLIEAVQKHVKDPEVLRAIGEEVQAVQSIRSLQ
jgi:hypothetical protein